LTNISISHIEIRPLDSEEGAKLVVKYLQGNGDYEDDQPRVVSELVGGLPLAIAHIAGLTNSSGCSLQDFIDIYHDKTATSKVWSYPPGASTFHYDKSLAIVFDVALEALAPDARELINVLAFLSPDSLPEAMVFREEDQESLASLEPSKKFQ